MDEGNDKGNREKENDSLNEMVGWKNEGLNNENDEK